ncbi:MAG: helix-turn-helix domain-containing protein [Hyphomonadaceae bacterium]|nr:helix-turn-helix domain-containing protein [Hyphomonadaceae bacterium]
MWTIPGLTETGAQARILNAAFRCFARYGYARTGMTDIAKEAGLSRTALYKHYPGLEDVFRALSQRVNQGVRQAVIEAAATKGDLTTRLQAVVAARVSWAFEAINLSEHGHELIDAKNTLCGKAGADTEVQFRKLLAAIVTASGASPAPAMSAATVIVKCIPGLVVDQTSEQAAREQVAQFVRTFAAGIEAQNRTQGAARPARSRNRSRA